ncbi:UpxY family transcription antiterminator [Candidatus Poribacteria bacterium]|nr:UpxY family transcription antiterminator [Candidatus Poribacteria bacterium]
MTGLIDLRKENIAKREPEHSLDFLSLSNDPNKKWCVLHTKSRREKKLAQRCSQLGIQYYLPLRKSVTGRRGRRHVSDVPLFPGYLFCCMDRGECWGLLQTDHIANVLDVVDQKGLVTDLNNIKDACERGVLLKPCALVDRGQRVRILDGPFAGLEGIVRKHLGGFRLVLTMECIQQAVACEVDVRMVVPI